MTHFGGTRGLFFTSLLVCIFAVIFLLVISFIIEYIWRKKNHQNMHWLGKN